MRTATELGGSLHTHGKDIGRTNNSAGTDQAPATPPLILPPPWMFCSKLLCKRSDTYAFPKSAFLTWRMPSAKPPSCFLFPIHSPRFTAVARILSPPHTHIATPAASH